MADLAEGSQGHEVSTLQQALVDKGYFVGAVDGIFGPRTAAAVGYFQSTNSLHIDRTAGSTTFALLGIGTAPARIEMRMVEAHVDNNTHWYIPVSAVAVRIPLKLRVSGVFSARNEQLTSETTAEADWLGTVIFLPIPDAIRALHGEEVHVHVTAYTEPDNTLADEKSGSFFITERFLGQNT